MAFYGYHRSKCTEDKDAIQKYLVTDSQWEIHLQRQSHFMQNCPDAKHLQKLGTLEIRIIRKTRKISVRCFQSKFEVGKKKKSIFTLIQFLLLPFLKKLVSFPTHLLSTHTQSNTESSQCICVLHHGQ